MLNIRQYQQSFTKHSKWGGGAKSKTFYKLITFNCTPFQEFLTETWISINVLIYLWQRVEQDLPTIYFINSVNLTPYGALYLPLKSNPIQSSPLIAPRCYIRLWRVIVYIF